MIKYLLFSFLLATGGHLWAQQFVPAKELQHKFNLAQHYLWDRGSSFTSQSNLFKEIDLSAYELLSGNISFSDKDQTQKIVVSPFRLLNNTQQLGMLTNTKFNVTLKDKITTVGIGFSFDNSVYYSNRARKIRDRIFCETCLPVPGIPEPADVDYDLFLQGLIKRLQDTISLKGISDANEVQRIKARNQEIIDSLRNFYHTRELQAVFDKFQKEQLAIVNKKFDSLLLAYDKAIANNVIKWTVGYNFQLFPNLFTRGAANGFDSLNYHNLKSHNISGSVTYSHGNSSWVLVATYNQIFAYTAAEKAQKKVPYYGPAFIASKRVVKFVSQSTLDTMAAYKKSLFVPSVNLGISFEGKYADGAAKYTEFYQDKTKRTVAWMPFVDLLFTPALQFRIGIPITRMRFPTGEKQVFTGANVQYNFKLSNLAL